MFINYLELDSVFCEESVNYPAEKSKYILELMEYHKIGFRNIGGAHGLIVPCAAPYNNHQAYLALSTPTASPYTRCGAY